MSKELIVEKRLKLEVGKFYKTRAGYKAEVTHIDHDDPPDIFKGIIPQYKQSAATGWHEDGFWDLDKSPKEYDLIEEWQEL